MKNDLTLPAGLDIYEVEVGHYRFYYPGKVSRLEVTTPYVRGPYLYGDYQSVLLKTNDTKYRMVFIKEDDYVRLTRR